LTVNHIKNAEVIVYPLNLTLAPVAGFAEQSIHFRGAGSLLEWTLKSLGYMHQNLLIPCFLFLSLTIAAAKSHTSGLESVTAMGETVAAKKNQAAAKPITKFEHFHFLKNIIILFSILSALLFLLCFCW
jgi:hypothetical protein